MTATTLAGGVDLAGAASLAPVGWGLGLGAASEAVAPREEGETSGDLTEACGRLGVGISG